MVNKKSGLYKQKRSYLWLIKWIKRKKPDFNLAKELFALFFFDDFADSFGESGDIL